MHATVVALYGLFLSWLRISYITIHVSFFHIHRSFRANDCSWAPFDGDDHKLLLGALDYAFLFAYAIGLFLSGHVAERLNLRYYLGEPRVASVYF